jgi:tetratricopeptide (TPR) repeat protein
VTALVILLRRRYPALLAAWVCHLVLLVPLLGLFNLPYYPSDRYSYLQGMVWSGVAAAGLVHLGDRLRARLHQLVLLAVPVTLLVAAAALTNRQVRVWSDSEILFRHMLAEFGTDPYRWDIHMRLGRHYLLEGRLPEAVDQFDKTLALVPSEPRTLYLKGMALLQQGESGSSRSEPRQATDRLFLAAADLLDRSAAMVPAPETFGAAGFAYAHVGRLPDAEDRLVRGLQLSPDDVRTRLGLGMVLHRLGRAAEAMAQLEEAVRIKPDLAAEREQILETWRAFDTAPAANR